MTLLAYRFALDPTPTQERALRSHAGAARVAYNWGLARVKANLDQRTAERSYAIADADLTPAISWSLYSLRKDWNAVKDTVAPWCLLERGVQHRLGPARACSEELG